MFSSVPWALGETKQEKAKIIFSEKAYLGLHQEQYCEPRQGIIIDCPQKDLFHNLINVILTSRITISEMVDNDNVKVGMINIARSLYTTVYTNSEQWRKKWRSWQRFPLLSW